MANMQFKCPQCGQMVECDEAYRGKVAECPHCGKGIVVPRGEPTATIGNHVHKMSTPPHTERHGILSANTVRTQREQIAIPSRLAPPPKVDIPAMPSKKGGRLRKVVLILCVMFGVVLAIGVASYGAYLYFGDAPRLERSIKHYENKRYDKAFSLLRPLAQKGIARAQLYLGDCYANGNGVILDTDESVKWYRAAADQGLAEAQHRMYTCCHDGVGIERSTQNATKWCRKAAEAGFDDAMFDMGMLYVRGEGVEKNAKSAFKWFRKGAEHGDPRACYKFGQCYKLGYGVEKDEDEAQKWQTKAVSTWRVAANGGNALAMIRIAELYMEGDVVELDKEEAVKWYRKAAETGNAYAQFELAECYYMAKGVEKDAEEAARWMRKAADHGTLPISQCVMGRFYQDGTGVEKDSVEAVKWFERATKKGFSPAKYLLAMCYLRGDGVQQDEAKAKTLLEEAAAAGDKDAKKELRRIKDEWLEQAKRIAQEKADKAKKIKRLTEIEDEIAERKERINSILKGTFTGVKSRRPYDDWQGFDAGKIAMTDASVSISEEQPLQRASDKLSDTDDIEKITQAIVAAQEETKRLEERLAEIIRVKKVYDEKELASRKEKCVHCGGRGSVTCVRCNGKGSVVARDTKPCRRCGGIDNETAFVTEARSGKGRVRVEVECNNCSGKGRIRPKCTNCNGNGRIKVPNVTGKLSKPYETCPICNGSGRGFEEFCPTCSGNKKVEAWRQCPICGGKGELSVENNETCTVCKGRGNIMCDHCSGRGFTYRPKNSFGDATKGNTPSSH